MRLLGTLLLLLQVASLTFGRAKKRHRKENLLSQHLGANVFREGGEIFAGRKVYGAVINTDPKMSMVMGRDFHKVPQGVKGSPASNAIQRLEQSRNVAAQMPFTVESWWSVYTQSCPNTATKGNDRGVMLAHYQIWSSFAYRSDRSIKGLATADQDDDDILVIFEDDASIAVNNVTRALYTELSVMKTDLLFLGWCYGRRYIPACLHAYALSRAGARKLVSQWDVCSDEAIDGQLRDLAKAEAFTWDKAADATFLGDLRPGYEDNPHYFTRGIFVQRNGLVSFNHHGYQNNAG
jgi:hypothetical protein